MKRILLSACMIVAVLLPGSLLAQQITGEIQGVITDNNGGALPGVTVTVKNQDTGISRTVITDATGSYSARALQPGAYEVTAALEGLQTTRQTDVRVLVAQVIDINLTMEVESTSEVITVTAESPLIEVSRTSAANYLDETAIEALPISGRDFTNYALLTPTVQVDRDRGFLTMSGQRGIYTGLNVDGANNKSTFFGYGVGGEATENEGLVIAQDSVKEFQVITNEFSPEFGRSGGGSINVITRSGTNQLKGSVFFQTRDDSLASDIPNSPLGEFRGQDFGSEIAEFERTDLGFSIGGPISQDRTHYFFAVDSVERDDPFIRRLDTATNWSGCGDAGSTNCLSVYDAILLKAQSQPEFASLVDGYVRQADGSAVGNFVRSIENQILFGKIDHQFTDSQSASLRINYTDFDRSSEFLDEESSKLEETTSIIGSWTSIIGSNAVNEFRFQQANDDLDRLSGRVGSPFEGEIRFQFGDFDEVGKDFFLPIFVEEDQIQIKNDFSYLFGSHDMKFGVDYDDSNLKQLFAGFRDGRYDFTSVDNFLNDNASDGLIYFGDVTFPNYDEAQQSLGVYAQDSLKRGDLTINYGLRYEAEYNPDDLEHIFPEGRDIPDDTDNIAPRLGLAWSPNGTDVLRGGAGLYFGRTPTLLFAGQVQQTGVFPSYGIVFVAPFLPGWVPFGTPIDNRNPPDGTLISTTITDSNWELAEIWRFNVGYERQLARNWRAGVDLLYAEGSNLQRNDDRNRTVESRDQFGRPIYSGTRPEEGFGELLIRASNGESEYTALTFKIDRRYAGRYYLGAHYTWSEDQDTDSNERSATGVTITDSDNLRFDWGLSDRDVEHRFVVHGMIRVPGDVQISGVFEYRSGFPYTALSFDEFHDFPGGDGPFDGRSRAVIGGALADRNGERNESINTVDLRVSKFFEFGRYRIDLYGQAFNLFNENSFSVTSTRAWPELSAGVANPEFGLGSALTTTPRQYELGVRFSF